MTNARDTKPGYLRTVAKLAAGVILTIGGTPTMPAAAAEVLARPTATFLDSIGVVSTFEDRGQPYEKTLEMLRFGGFRWLRGGIEGLSEDGPLKIDSFLRLHKEAGVKISWGLGSGIGDLDRLLSTGRILAEAGALLAFEGNNEPNNWPVTYKGREGGGRASWLPVAELHADLYRAVKSDPVLADYPVWSVSEPGAQTDNAGLQFLEIPENAGTLMPSGTRFADYANVHNYLYHPNVPDPADNKSWDAADPTSATSVDGLFGNFGRTWANRHKGYPEAALADLPRVTTETGVAIKGAVDEALQGVNLVNLYLSQFSRGYSYTSVYILRDRTDEQGAQTYGFFRPDFTPRLAANYLRNLTRILADSGRWEAPDRLDYEISPQPATVHDLLLQHSDGAFQLVIWGEALVGESKVQVTFREKAKQVELYDAIKGSTPIETWTDTSQIELGVSDHPLVLKLVF
ncbi:MAG: glycosyl hydrolase [Alphaproteobacteria bacterium]|nr:glycosyl hydrolase [Alphaproteobacteria bacterium]